MNNNGYKFISDVNYLAVGFVLLQLIFGVVCVSSISTLMVDEKISADDYADKFSVGIKNIDEFQEGLTDAQVDTIQGSLLDVVRRNAFQVNLSSDGASVREGSVIRHYFAYQDLNYISGILDIPSLRQSYQIFYEYSKDSENRFLTPNASAIILCIDDQNDIIYESFECNNFNMYDSKTRNRIVAKYIKFFSFSDFIVNVDTDSYENVNIYVVSDGANDQDKEEYKQSVKDAIRSLGISPNIFKYNVF